MAIIAGAAPKFEIVITIIGAFFGTILQFFFPLVLYNVYFANTISTFKLIFNYFVILLGMTGGIIATYHILQKEI